MRRPSPLTCLFGLIAVLGSAPADAEEAPMPGWFLPLGLNLGGSVALADGDGGFVVGGEVSAVHLFGTPWLGVYGDGLYDTGADAGRVSTGLEAGWLVFGVELGYAAEIRAGGVDNGLRAGALLTSSLLGGYVRWVHLVRDARADVLEIGVLLKWPFEI